MKVYIDITSLMVVTFISGIQRVVRELAGRLIDEKDADVRFLFFNEREDVFEKIAPDGFKRYFVLGEGKKEDLYTNETVLTKHFEPGDVFLEMDSVWHSKYARMNLYPELKSRGVKIAVFFHDIIPVMWPQYADRLTVAKFAGFISAAMVYADLFISSTRTNIDYLHKLMEQTGVRREVPCFVSRLGMDFKVKKPGADAAVRSQGLKNLKKYVLMVGTIEPRKNHRLVLDAFDNELFEKGWGLVIAGKIGWDVKELEKRIRQHARMDKEFFYLENAGDEEIDLLYKNARFVVFPSFTEGFGLPIAEAAMRGVPVLSSDHPVMKEVGGEWCRYFDPHSERSFIDCINTYDEPEEYEKLKKNLSSFQALTWDEVERNVWDAVKTLRTKKAAAGRMPKQMVMLSARADDVLKTLPYVEAYMAFINELVLCCPDFTKNEIEKNYVGRLKIIYLTDDMIAKKDELPKDHAARNIFLRSNAIKSDVIDDVFIMSDDDYRPLKEIEPEVYIKDEKYQAYYMGDMRKWSGAQGNSTSFDISIMKNCDFLMEKGYPTYMFDSHMPQIIDKGLYCEMMEKYPEDIKNGRVTEWSGYFNYVLGTYPDILQLKPYVTMNWPGHMEDWEVQVHGEEYLFENFYEELYGDDAPYGKPGCFRGFSKEFNENTPLENIEKKRIITEMADRHNKCIHNFKKWYREFEKKTKFQPVFAVYTRENKAYIACPDNMEITAADFLRIRFSALNAGTKKDNSEWQMTWGIYSEGRLVTGLGSARFMSDEESFEALVITPESKGNYQLEWHLYTDKNHAYAKTDLNVI